jgi:hypothetical protein
MSGHCHAKRPDKRNILYSVSGERKEPVWRAARFVVSSVEVIQFQQCSLARVFKEMIPVLETEGATDGSSDLSEGAEIF